MKKYIILIIIFVSFLIWNFIPFKLKSLLNYFTSVRICNDTGVDIKSVSIRNPLQDEKYFFSNIKSWECSEYKNTYSNTLLDPNCGYRDFWKYTININSLNKVLSNWQERYLIDYYYWVRYDVEKN